MANYAEQSSARNKRAGGTGSASGDSSARENRIGNRDRVPGESQTSADTRNAQSKTQPSHRVPFSVREAQWRRQGYGGASKRMAQFQASSMGQSMGMGGTASDPYGKAESGQKPDPLPSPESNEGGNTEAQPQSGVLRKALGAVARGASQLMAPLLPDPNSPQANFMNRSMSGGPLSNKEIADAQAYAKSMGTTFDPRTGYDRSNFMGEKSPELPSVNMTPKPKSTRVRTFSDPAAAIAQNKQDPAGPKLLSDGVALPVRNKPEKLKIPSLPDLNF